VPFNLTSHAASAATLAMSAASRGSDDSATDAAAAAAASAAAAAAATAPALSAAALFAAAAFSSAALRRRGVTSLAISAAAISAAAISAAAISAATFAFAPSISAAESDAMCTGRGAAGSRNAHVESFTSPCVAAAALSSACSPFLYSLCLRAARTYVEGM